MTGQVIKGVGGIYTVKTDDGRLIECNARGKLKRFGDIYIGDYVELHAFTGGNGSIEEILPRKNSLIRPYISNIDAIVICIAPVPRPDFMLVDKLLINCLAENIEPIICVNKTDIADDEFLSFIHNNYDELADIVEVSAENGENLDKLLALIDNKYVCFSGQSAVGKSSIINRIFGAERLAVGELSRKTDRGKHCTRHIEIFEYGSVRIADTCGFSSLTLSPIPPEELSTYFSDFDKFSDKCRFRGCNHINEPSCAVIKAVKDGELDKARYDRYLNLYKACEKQWSNRY